MRRGILSLGVVALVFALTVGLAMAQPVTFSDVTESAGAYGRKQGIAPGIGDYDNDGDMDMYLTHAFHGPTTLGRNNRLYENNGDGTFTNVAEEKGVDGIVEYDPPGPENDVTGLGRGVSWGDCDNDGDLDLLVGNMDSSDAPFPFPLTTLYINNGPPNFDFTWTSCSRGLHQRERKRECTDEKRGGLDGTSGGIAWGDYDQDGCLDIVWRVTDQHADSVLLKNQKQGGVCTCTFKEVTRRAGANLFYPLRKTAFTSEEGLLPRSLVLTASLQGNANWVDYDNDGDQDLFHPNDGDMNVMFKNNGDGTFTDVATVPGREANALANIGQTYGACWGDLDNDGDLDCYITNSGEANRLVRNDLMENGEPGFTDRTFEEIPPRDEDRDPLWSDSGAGDLGDATSCTMGDYDNDGYLDIYVNQGGPRNILFNDENYMPTMNTQFYSAVTPAENVLLRNNGPNGEGFVTFSDITEGSGAEANGEGRGVATTDYDNDGRLDLYVTDLQPEGGPEQEAVLLNNTTENSNNWIKVEVRGTVSNVGGLGVRVECVSPSFTQIREVTGGHGYNSQDDPRAHFGLGSGATVSSIEVTWPKPNLSTQTLNNPAINKTYVCTEGAACVEK
jgi:hypothetical protein